MTRFDITQTNAAVERLIETTENPRHLYLLHAYNRHRYLEMAGRYKEIFAPDMAAMLASAGLEPPPSARIGARLGLGSTPTVDALLTALRS